MVAYLYVPINLVLCGLLSLEIIARGAFIGMLASTFVYWENKFVGQKEIVGVATSRPS